MQRSAMFLAFAVSVAMLATCASDTQAQPVTARCSAAKIQCASSREAALLLCHAKAEGRGSAVDPACVARVETKFSDPISGRGCMEKAEARPPCATTGDTSALASMVDDFVGGVVGALDPQFPTPVLDRCGAGKKKCVATEVKELLACYQKAAARGVAADPACLQKARDKFGGGSVPSRGCFARLEVKFPLTGSTPCQTFGDAGALATLADDLARDVNAGLRPATILDFTIAAGNGDCGSTRDGSSALLATLACGYQDLGDGNSVQPEAPIPTGRPPVRPRLYRHELHDRRDVHAARPRQRGPRLHGRRVRLGTPVPRRPRHRVSLDLHDAILERPASGTLDLASGSSTMSSRSRRTRRHRQRTPALSAVLGDGLPRRSGNGNLRPRATSRQRVHLDELARADA